MAVSVGAYAHDDTVTAFALAAGCTHLSAFPYV
jgi:hypothetical protein